MSAKYEIKFAFTNGSYSSFEAFQVDAARYDAMRKFVVKPVVKPALLEKEYVR